MQGTWKIPISKLGNGRNHTAIHIHFFSNFTLIQLVAVKGHFKWIKYCILYKWINFFLSQTCMLDWEDLKEHSDIEMGSAYLRFHIFVNTIITVFIKQPYCGPAISKDFVVDATVHWAQCKRFTFHWKVHYCVYLLINFNSIQWRGSGRVYLLRPLPTRLTGTSCSRGNGDRLRSVH